MRRAILVFLSLSAVAALVVRVAVPWYVNSGRARIVIEGRLRDQLDAEVHVGPMTMPHWMVVTIPELRIASAALGVVHAQGIEIRGTLAGLLRRRIAQGGAQQVSIHLPVTDPHVVPDRPTLGAGATGELPVVERVSLPNITIARGHGPEAEPFVTVAASARHVQGRTYDIDLSVHGSEAAIRADGRMRYVLGEARPQVVRLTFSADWEQLLALTGREALAGSGVVSAVFAVAEGVGTLEAQLPALSWAEVDVEASTLVLSAPLDYLRDSLPVDVAFTSGGVRLRDQVTAPGPVDIRGIIEIERAPRRVRWADVELAWDAGVVWRSDGSVSLTENATGSRADIQVHRTPVLVFASYIPALESALARVDSIGGEVDGAVTAAWGTGPFNVSVQGRWSGGTIALDEFRQAADVNVDLTAELAPSNTGAWTITGGGTFAPGEVLWNSYYQSFADRAFPVQFDAVVAPDSAGMASVHASADLAGLGRWSIARGAPGSSAPAGVWSGRGAGIKMETLLRDVVVPLFAESRPWTQDVQGRGDVHIAFDVTSTDDAMAVQGRLQLADVFVEDPSDQLGIEGLHVDLPFRLGPGARPTAAAPPTAGTVAFAALRLGPSEFDGATLPVQVWDNTVQVRAPYQSALFGGVLRLEDIRGSGILTSDREWRASIALRDVDLAQAARAWDTVALEGSLAANFPQVHFARNRLTAEGALDATIYGGAFALTRFGIEDVASPYRTYTADASWTGIDLARATEALGFGRMTGVLDGAIRGLRIEAHQPAAFEAEFHTVRTPGVSQTVSIEAVNNISILGTGRGLGGLLARGLRSLFDEYKYEHVGFTCALENDRFTIHGGATGPEGEYFVKGTVLPPRINVIRRDPTGTISFSEMVRRFDGLRLRAAASAPEKGSAL